MNYSSFIETLKNELPPQDISKELQALWWLKKEDWDKAHDLVQDLSSKNAASLHALLHKIEGDLWNADYWYSKASKRDQTLSEDVEWEKLVHENLEDNNGE